jgi:hypothetical protein
MTRRAFWALPVSAAAALLAWILVARDGPEPDAAASRAQKPLLVDTFEAALATPPTSAQQAPDRTPTSGARTELRSGRASDPTFSRRAALYAEAAAADEQQLQMLIAQARADPDPIERLAALEILLLKLAQRDASAAVRAALDSERADALHLIGALAANAPEAVWRALDQVGDPLARMELQTAVIGAWTLSDVDRAFNSVAALSDNWAREQLLRQTVWAAARRDPQRAVELVNTRPPAERDGLLLVVADQWARNDPAAAARWIERLSVRTQGQLAFRIAGPFVTQQPEEALAWALRISRTPSRNLWSHMIGLIAMRDPEEALRRAQAAENPAQRTQAMARAVAAIAARDPALATTYARKLPPGQARTEAISEVATQIARTRPEAAVDWLRELDGPEMRAAAANAIAAQIASTDPDAAARMVDRVPKDARQYWVTEVARAYSDVDPERGIEWVNRWRDESSFLASSFMQRLAMRSPDEALALVDRLATDEERDRVVTQIVGFLAMQSPEAAAQQMSRIRDEEARLRAASALSVNWAQHDAQGASKWARAQEAGRIRDTALSSIASEVHDLDSLLEIVGDIQSPDYQMSAVFNAASRRVHSDPEMVQALLRRYPLDPQRQQQLEAIRQRRR